MKKLELIILIIFSTIKLWAQEPFSIAINQTNGLQTNAIYDIFQDSKGFMWFATENGLVKYDGTNFKTITSNKLTSKAGSCIKEDSYGRIWYENFDGFIYYVKEDIIYNFKVKSNVNYIPYAITNKYVFTLQGAYVVIYDVKKLQKIKIFELKDKVPENSCQNEDSFYFIGNNRIYKVDENLILSVKSLASVKGKFWQIFADKNCLAVVSKFNEYKTLHILDSELNFKSTYNIPQPKLIRGANFIDQKFWIYTSTGIFTYANNKLNNWYFKEKNVSSVLKDKQGNFWIGTTNEGVFFVPNIKSYSYPFPNYNPTKIVKTDQKLIIASSRGHIYEYNQNLDKPKMVFNKTDLAEIYYSYLDTINKNYFFSSKGCFIVPNLNFRKAQNIDLAVKEVVRLDENYYAISSSGTNGLIKSPTFNKSYKSIWDNCFNLYKSNILENYAPISSLNNRGRCVAYNSKDTSIYYGGNLGLYKITPSKIEKITHNNVNFFASKIIIINNKVYSLSTTGDLYQIINNKSFKPLNKLLGFKPEAIKLIKELNSQIFIVSNNSICQFNTTNNQVKTIEINIKSLIVNDILKDKDHLLLLIEKGILRVALNGKVVNPAFPKFEINYLKIDNKIYKPFNVPKLNYHQNDITINYSILDFGNSKPFQNFYKLNNEVWKPLNSNTNEIQFSSLSPGTYTIKFKNTKSEFDQTINFTIKNPFWLTWWFFSIIVLLFGALSYLYNRWRIGVLSKQIILLQEKIELEQNLGKSILTSIKSQMNPHFFYNALNTIQAYIFSNDKKNASFYLGKFSKLTRMILEMSEKESISLSVEIKALNLYLDLEKMRFDSDFDYQFYIDEKIDEDLIKIPSMLIQPYVENAIKHGLLHKQGDKKLLVSFTLNNQILEVNINDNGVGRKYAEAVKSNKYNNHQPFATQANQKRLNILNKYSSKKVAVVVDDKFDDNNRPIGTSVTVNIPIN